MTSDVSTGCADTFVVIPAYQPSKQLISLANALAAAGYPLIVVDDGSAPEYQSVFQQLEAAVILRHTVNRGKGAALKTAFRYLYEAAPSAARVITMDADGQHLLQDMMQIAEAVKLRPDALILGARTFDRDVPLRSRLGNKLTRLVFSCVASHKIRDTQTGLRGFDRRLLENMLTISGDRYEYEMNVLLSCSRHSIPIVEIPIQTVYLDQKNSTSHFHSVADSLRIYRKIFQFAASSFLSFLADYFLFLLFYAIFPRTSAFLMVDNVLARLLSAALNYTLNTKAVFRDPQPVSKTLPQYAALAAGILVANSFLLFFFADIVCIPPEFAKILTEISLFLISFSVQSLFIFRQDKKTDRQ